MATTITPNMSLIIPTAGQEPGPDYATDVNSSLTLVDQHDHSPGKGVQITPAGLNINDDLDFNGNFAIDVAGITLEAQVSTPAVNTLYENGVDLYFVDGLGNNIRITQSGGVAGTPGSIANLVPPASATYVAGSKTFVWQSAASTAANMDNASIIMRNITPNSTFGLTLQPPSALSQNYSITLPTLPVANSFMQISTLGVVSASIAVSGGITASNIAAGTQIPVVIASLTDADSPYSLAVGTGMASADTTSGSITINLYTAVGNQGKRVIIKKTASANTVTIEPDGSETIDGQAQFLLLGIDDSVTLISNGSNWLVVELDLVQFINATVSPALIPTTGLAWYQASGNSVSLIQGVWELTGKATFGTTGAISSNQRIGWFSANGNNTNTMPAALTNATVLGGYEGAASGAGSVTSTDSAIAAGFQYHTIHASVMTVRVAAAGATIFLNCGADANGTSHEYSMRITAKRIR